MHSQNPFLDEFAKLTQAAMGIAQTAGEEAKTAMRAQADRLAAEFDLIRRDDFEALKAEVASLREEVASLKGPRSRPPPRRPPEQANRRIVARPRREGAGSTASTKQIRLIAT
jgi:BMFP domain-containing protein YqiC